ncbi:hypothetical protein GA0115251_11253 [Streptomyces sp. TverLS-915]|uniref:DUF6344 domain-containing protein n=1 Tax=Streptomyces sp. TverLS-915 TaxID=1839763 RepID=UPI00081E3BEB|nr:DUF6344 domain-containing protein [Streptomyces sp. TverLS-915]SCD56337.1 hypothetical protein GA0115251_11253 [Streptomyces sp. TverLS-915]
MAAQTFSTLWKALVGAFLALFAFLGLAAVPAQAAAPATPAPQPRELPCEENGPQGFAVATALFGPPLVQGRSLPPTMKQRIRAEQHGSSPSCRQLVIPLNHPYTTGAAPALPAARAALGTPRTAAAVSPATATEHTTAGTPEPAADTLAHPLPAARPAEPTPETDPAPFTGGIPGPADALDAALPRSADAPLPLPGIPAAREHRDGAQAHTSSTASRETAPLVTSAP